MTAPRLDRVIVTVAVETLLAWSQPRFFTALGDLDWYSNSHRQWFDDLDLGDDVRVLELGCATGSLTAYIESRRWRVIGLDRSEGMIQRASKLRPEIRFVVGDGTSLAIDDGTFGAVVAASLLNVVPDAESVLSEMQRVVVPGGTVSILVPSTEFTDKDLDTLVEQLRPTGFSRAALTKWHGSARKMSGSRLQALLLGVGLQRVETRTYLGGMLVAASGIARTP